MLVTRPNYVPRAQASCSAVSAANKCERAWAYRYIVGIDEPDFTWEEAKRLIKPTKPKTRDAVVLDAHRENVKLFNRTRRKALGKEGHGILETWAGSFYSPDDERHRDASGINWHDVPGRTVLAGLGEIPHPSTLLSWDIEQPLAEDFVSRVTGGKLDFEFNGFVDYVARPKPEMVFASRAEAAAIRGTWQPPAIVVDYKTTSSFDWIKTPQELQDDPQGIIYPLDVMLSTGLEQVDCRWIYFLTEGAPKARAVDFTVTRSEALRRALPIVNRADELISKIKRGLTVDDTAGNPAACELYGGCIYHASRGGPCAVEVSRGKIARAKASLNRTGTENIIMGFRKAAQAAGAIGGGTQAANPAGQPQTQSQPAEGAAGAEPAAGGGAADQTAAGEAAASGARRGAPRGARRNVAGDDAPSISIVSGDSSIELPKSSPLYAQASSVFSALFPE